MKRFAIPSVTLIAVVSIIMTWISINAPKPRDPLQGGNGTEYGDGGAAVSAHDGISAMPGCDGGTNAARDGRFYISGTTQQCNPSDRDREKALIQQ